MKKGQITNPNPQALARLNDLMAQAGQAANKQAARVAFDDHTARKANNTIRRKIAGLALFETFLNSAGVTWASSRHSRSGRSLIFHRMPQLKVS